MVKQSKKSTQAEIENLKKEIRNLKAGWQRAQADFENYKKRAESEQNEVLALIKADFLAKITPVLDNFRRAFEHVSKDDNTPVVQGLRQIEKQLEDILSQEGLEKIPAQAGAKFDPKFHEAISYEENHLPKDSIISELESGWLFQDRIIKPAKVRVSKGK